MLPQSCVLCAADSADCALCPACDAQLPRLPAARCSICALPVPEGEICGTCLAHPPHFDQVSAAFAYDYPVDSLIQSYKYGSNLALATLLGGALTQAVPQAGVDLIVPVPLSPPRLRERGFNQALELARHVSRSRGIPLAADICRKVAHTLPQAALPWKARAQNVRGAYVCDASLDGMRVAVVDDVMTTGATLNELARNLRLAGAAVVSGWVVARALRKSAIKRVHES